MMGSRTIPTQEAPQGVSFSYVRFWKILKGRVWWQLETYLQHPGCDLYGEILAIHPTNDEGSFCYSGSKTGSCTLNPKLIERLEITNAFSRCRDSGVINEKDYNLIKSFNLHPKRHQQLEYNTLMHVVTGEMVRMLYSEVHTGIVKGE